MASLSWRELLPLVALHMVLQSTAESLPLKKPYQISGNSSKVFEKFYSCVSKQKEIETRRQTLPHTWPSVALGCPRLPSVPSLVALGSFLGCPRFILVLSSVVLGSPWFALVLPWWSLVVLGSPWLRDACNVLIFCVLSETAKCDWVLSFLFISRLLEQRN